MIEGLMFLASYGFDSGAVGNMLSKWEQAGFFSYVLPFLLLFALIFGILTRAQIFKENKAVNSIIALVVALMALQFDFVPQFFAEIFPRLGVGLAVILVGLILVGLFMNEKQVGIFFGLGAIIFVVILINTAGDLGWSSAGEWADNWVWILMGALAIFAFVMVINSVNPKKTAGGADNSPLARALRGD